MHAQNRVFSGLGSIIIILDDYHYENMSMQYTEIFKVVKNEYFQ